MVCKGIAVPLMVFSKNIIVLLFGAEFQEASNLLRIMALSIVCYSGWNLMVHDCAAKGRSDIIFRQTLALLVMNAVLMFLMLKFLNIYYAAGVNVFTSLVLMIYMLIFYKKNYKLKILENILVRKKDIQSVLEGIQKIVKSH